MGYILNRFGITKSILGDDMLYERLVNSQEASLQELLLKALHYITPVECGFPMVRIGPNQDGGYVVPDDLEGIDACFSPGVNNRKDFEDDLAIRYGIKSYMCDKTSDINAFKTPLIAGMQFFEKKWLDINNDQDNININTWVESNSDEKSDLILQMDIEGGEYKSLLAASASTLSRFRILILEVHELSWLSKAEFLEGIFLPFFSKLDKFFACVHAHPNNCCGQTVFFDKIPIPNVLEITLLRKDRVRSDVSFAVQIPHELDVVNVIYNAPLHISGPLRQNADSVKSDVNALKQTTQWIEKSLVQFDNYKLVADFVMFLSIMQKNRCNVALNKNAIQSSLSIWSTPEGANGAINGIKTGKFGFHTNVENNPWWSVDLGGVCSITEIVIYNRVDACPERIRTLKIYFSLDNINWEMIYDHNNKQPFGGVQLVDGLPPLLIHVANKQTRYVKLVLFEETAFHLDEVEIYGTEM